mgnify:CR=1 FL=1
MFKEEEDQECSTVGPELKRNLSLASSEQPSETSSMAPMQPQLFMAIGTRPEKLDIFKDHNNFNEDSIPDEAS